MDNNVLNKEERFHDEWAESVNVDEIDVTVFFEAAVMPENRRIMQWLGSIKGKKILELGCGLGEASSYLAMKGGNVVATDISAGMLNVASRLALKNGVNIDTVKCDADRLPFEDNQFDIVFCSDLLHHVDIEITAKEVRRVLTNDGIFVGHEPIAYNPAINIYRKIARDVRTDDEHPLKVQDIKMLRKIFGDFKCEYTWFTTLIIFLKFYFVDRYNPNEIRYWKQILVEYEKLEKLYKPLEKIDNILLRIFPFLKLFCWNVVFIAEKK